MVIGAEGGTLKPGLAPPAPQPALMHLQLADRHQFAIDPSGDHLFHSRMRVHDHLGDTSPSKCAMFFTPIFRCAIGRALTNFLFI